MGLDISFYEVKRETFLRFNGKEEESVSRGSETCYFRKNYVLMEWLERYFNTEIENCQYYIIDRSAIKALIADCELVIDLVRDANKKIKKDTPLVFSQELKDQIKKIFPNNGWNEKDFVGYDEEKKESIYKPHEFDYHDYTEINYTCEQISKLHDEEYIFCADW